jgi:hypothetical protein
MSKLSFTLEGGIGDYITKYLGFPGNRLFSLQKNSQIEFRLGSDCRVGCELLRNSPFFTDVIFFNHIDGFSNILNNDITLIDNIKEFPKISVPLWLNDQEEDFLLKLKKPYAVFHPFASHLSRNLSFIFDIHVLAQWIADYSGLNLLVLGNEEFGYQSSNVIDLAKQNLNIRLSCRIVEGASFFVGSHSCMQCAAKVYNIPSFCIGPSFLLFHGFFAPLSFNTYLKPLFTNNNMFMLYEQADCFMSFFMEFVSRATYLKPNVNLELFHRKIILSNKASQDNVIPLGIHNG